MICKRILPGIELKSCIKEYVVMHFLFGDISQPLPPKAYPVNPEEAIRFLVLGKLHSQNVVTGQIVELPAISVIGQPTWRQNLYISHQFLMVYIRFQPGCLFKLLKIPMTELVDQHIDATAIFGNEINEVHEQLAESETYDGMISILENYFISKFRKLKDNSHPIDSIGQSILQNPQGFNLERIAKEACFSHRQFEKRFQQLTGIMPKYFARICRFYRAYELKEYNPKLDWLSVAVRTGYNDYQHLVKDFKEFAGTTPNILISQSSNNPERALSVSDGFRGV